MIHRVDKLDYTFADIMALAPQPIDWQMNKSLVECNRYMFKHQINADVCFRIEPPNGEVKEIKCHKYVLISRSPVFNAMLYGSVPATNADGVIVVTDVEADAFMLMIGYLYTDEVTLNQDNVFSVLYASKKYLIPCLTNKCKHFLESTMSADNVCQIYEHSSLYEETHLQEKAKHFIETRTEDILHSPAFLDLPLSTLISVLQFDKLTVSELELFKMCVSWSIEECKRQGIDVNSKNQRQVLQDSIYLLRFPTLELKDFANIVARSGILSAEEKATVFEYLICDDKEKIKDELLFPIKFREQPVPSVLNRFTGFSKSSVISGDYSAMKLTCDKPVLIRGLAVSGTVNYDPLAEIQITVKQDRHVLYNRSVTAQDNRTGESIVCLLPETVLLQSHTWYIIKVTFHFSGEHDQGTCKRGKNGFKNMTVDGINFEFDAADSAGFVHQILFCTV